MAQEWIKPGHRRGSNTHNVSATISLKEDEWEKAGEWMWSNRDYYNGLSVLPYDGGTYTQAPFEDIDEAEYNKMSKVLSDVDLTKVTETDDNTDLSGELFYSQASVSLAICEQAIGSSAIVFNGQPAGEVLQVFQAVGTAARCAAAGAWDATA